jgi:hypothetical protein
MFTVRFPNALLIQEWACFNPISTRSVKAKNHINSWNGLVGAKGELQHAWFRVRGVPYDKRSAKALAYVGSLVGVTRKVDKSTLNRIDYVRVKIAAKDVSRVHASTEGAILTYLYDFFYERKVILEEKKEEKVSMMKVDKMDPQKLTPQKPAMLAPSTQLSKQQDVGKSSIGVGNAKKLQDEVPKTVLMEEVVRVPPKNPSARVVNENMDTLSTRTVVRTEN